MTRMVEPQAKIDRMNERGGNDRPTRHERNRARGENGRGEGRWQVGPHCADRSKDAKQHWKVPPVTRVRVRQRIRKWDGYL